MISKPHLMLIPALLAVLALAACGQEPPFDLEISGEGLAIGRSMHVHVAEIDGDVVIEDQSFPVNRDPLSVVFGDLLAEGVTYQFQIFLDLDDDGRCSAPPSDRIWFAMSDPIDGGLELDVGQLAQDAVSCGVF